MKLEIKNLSKSFGKKEVLKNIDSSILTTSILLNNPYFKYNDKIQQLIVNSNNVIVAISNLRELATFP